MGAIQYHFKRVEKKYFLTRRQYAYLLPRLAGLFAADEYGKTALCNIYYDTVDWRLTKKNCGCAVTACRGKTAPCLRS